MAVAITAVYCLFLLSSSTMVMRPLLLPPKKSTGEFDLRLNPNCSSASSMSSGKMLSEAQTVVPGGDPVEKTRGVSICCT